VPEVRRATPDDVAALTRSLASAFFDDPVSAFVFADAARRDSVLRDFFVVQLRRTYLPRGEVYTTAERAGASMWLGPNSQLPSLRDQLAYLWVALASGRFRASRRLSLVLQRLRPMEEHYYLGTIGVDPPRQHQGIGTALMRPGLARCDAQNLGAYLESSSEANTRFYAGMGFRVTHEITATRDGPRLWLMWREPQAPVHRTG
jgi:ribosomal protein S18 acetylase RimI-like enzyme